MAVEGYLKDGMGSGRRVAVTNTNAIKVAITSLAADDQSQEELTKRKFFTDYFKNGTSFEMNVNGSATPVDFQVVAPTGFVLFIDKVRLIFHDQNMDMGGGNAGRFASASAGALPNGVRLVVNQGGVETDLFLNNATTMADFFQFNAAFINITGAFGAGVDFLRYTFEFPQPIPLSDAITDKLFIRVQDNLSPINLFRAIATGVKEDVS